MGPHITQAWDVRHPRWHGSDGCPQQHSVVSCTNSTTFNGSGYTRLCQGSSMNSWLTWGYWYMFLLLKELLQPDGLPAPTHPLGRGVFNETPSLNSTNKIGRTKHCSVRYKHGIYIRHCQESNSQPVPSQAGTDPTSPQWRTRRILAYRFLGFNVLCFDAPLQWTIRNELSKV